MANQPRGIRWAHKDLRAIMATVGVHTKYTKRGAPAYVCDWGSNYYSRINILVETPNGKLVQRWVPARYLTDFRWVDLPPRHPARGWIFVTPNETDFKKMASATKRKSKSKSSQREASRGRNL